MLVRLRVQKLVKKISGGQFYSNKEPKEKPKEKKRALPHPNFLNS